jgi:hypothetical protein
LLGLFPQQQTITVTVYCPLSKLASMH